MDKVVKDLDQTIKYYISMYDEDFYSIKIEEVKQQFDFKNYENIYKLSKLMKDFVKKIDITRQESIGIIKNLAKKYTDDKYLIDMVKPCFESSIRFRNLLKKHDMHQELLVKDFMVSFYIIILYMPLGYINNLHLFECIQILWMLIDNIIDNKDMKHKRKLLKPIFTFLKDELYEDKDVMKYLFKYRDNICMSIICDIYKNSELKNKKEFFRDVRKLFMYSYTKKGIEVEMTAKSIDILDVSMKKSYLSHRLFKHCIYKNVVEDESFYYLCLMSQLSDDLLDLTEDLSNDGNTIFTSNSRKNRSIITLCIIDIIIERFPSIRKYMVLAILDAVLYNKHLHDPKFIEEIERHKFIDTQDLDFQEIEKIVFGSRIDDILDEKLVDLYDKEVEKESIDEIVIKIEALAMYNEFSEV